MSQLAVWRWIYWSFVTLAVVLYLAYHVATFFVNIPAVPRDNVVVFIPPNSNLRAMARVLETEGVLIDPWKLRLLARLLGKQNVLKPGEYRFNVPSPPLAILRTLIAGKVILHRVTFPEGITAAEMEQILARQKIIEPEEFRKIVSDRDVTRRFAIPAGHFEGFLFPDTYNFSRTDGPVRVVETMVGRFFRALTPEDQRRAQGLRLNLLQWVTLASIIEKESSDVAEQPVISSVFHNRLEEKMRLQSDPTVIYGIPNFNGNLTRKDLETSNPYNTYTNSGLPPGPIANPGASALHAAANPKETPYLYFVAKKTGGHVFAETYEEHRMNVAFYQLGKKDAFRKKSRSGSSTGRRRP